MGLFDFMKKKDNKGNMENTPSIELLEKHKKGEINDAEFLRGFGSIKVFYSTPFGDRKDGKQVVFLLPGPDNTGYHPVFTSQERLMEFYEAAGRVGFMIMNNTFTSVLETTNGVNGSAPVKMGIIIDPGYYDVTVDAAALETVIKMTK